MDAPDQRLRISFETPEAFQREYASNLCNGGVFIATNGSFEPRQTVRVEIQLEYARREIGIEAEVVHIVPQEMAAMGGKPGVAVQFTGKVGDVRATLAQLIGEDLPAAPVQELVRPEASKRAKQRATARVAAHIEGDGVSIRGRTRNLSQSGVLVGVQGGAIPVGETVQLTLEHPTTGETMGVQGRVARQILSDEEVTALAVEFEPEESEREDVERFVSEVQTTEHTRRLGGITGAIQELGPQSLVQMFANTAPQGTLYLRNDQLEGMICFDQQQIRYAQVGAATGMDALKQMIEWRVGTFEFHARIDNVDFPDAPLPLEAALLEAAPVSDESERGGSCQFANHDCFEVNPGADRCVGQLSKIEAAVVDLARAGFTVQRMLEVIPEPDPEILAALTSLADDEIISVTG